MTIRVGTLVTRLSPPTMHIDCVSVNPCEDHIEWERHAEAGTDGILDVCIGMVIECIEGETDVTVNWLQQCPYAKREGTLAQERIDFNLLWEVGQLR